MEGGTRIFNVGASPAKVYFDANGVPQDETDGYVRGGRIKTCYEVNHFGAVGPEFHVYLRPKATRDWLIRADAQLQIRYGPISRWKWVA